MKGDERVNFHFGKKTSQERGGDYELRTELPRAMYDFLEDTARRHEIPVHAVVKIILADYMDRVKRMRGYETGLNIDRIMQTRSALDREEES